MSTQIDALKAIKAHSQAVQAKEPGVVEVPEWGLTIYVWPMTVNEEEVLLEAHNNSENPYAEILASILVRSKNADGGRIFPIKDQAEPILRDANADIIRRIVGEMQTYDAQDTDVKKNLKKTSSIEPSTT